MKSVQFKDSVAFLLLSFIIPVVSLTASDFWGELCKRKAGSQKVGYAKGRVTKNRIGCMWTVRTALEASSFIGFNVRIVRCFFSTLKRFYYSKKIVITKLFNTCDSKWKAIKSILNKFFNCSSIFRRYGARHLINPKFLYGGFFKLNKIIGA